MRKQGLLGIGLASFLLFAGCKNKESIIAKISNGPSPHATRTEDSTAIYNKKTLEFKALSQWDMALSCSEKAIVFGKDIGSPELGNAYFNRAKIFQELSQYNNAIASFDSAIKYYLLFQDNYSMASQASLETARLHEKLGNKRIAENYRTKAEIFSSKAKENTQ